MRKRALITGISGQDGSYLSELLLSQGYDVWGLLRSATRQGSLPTSTFAQIHKLTGEIESYEQVSAAIAEAKPDECYHLAAQTFIGADARANEADFDVIENGGALADSAIPCSSMHEMPEARCLTRPIHAFSPGSALT